MKTTFFVTLAAIALASTQPVFADVLCIAKDKTVKLSTGKRCPKGTKLYDASRLVAQKLGPKGDQGPIGLKGEKGDRGEKGDPGEQGIQGFKGDTGEQGAPGDAGQKGERRPKGDKGDPGAPGSYGPMGPVGPRGWDGPTGAKGDKGDKGERGEKGDPALAFFPPSDLTQGKAHFKTVHFSKEVGTLFYGGNKVYEAEDIPCGKIFLTRLYFKGPDLKYRNVGPANISIWWSWSKMGPALVSVPFDSFHSYTVQSSTITEYFRGYLHEGFVTPIYYQTACAVGNKTSLFADAECSMDIVVYFD